MALLYAGLMFFIHKLAARKKPVTDIASFTRSAKSIFFHVIFHSAIFNAIISDFGHFGSKKYGLRAAIIQLQSGS